MATDAQESDSTPESAKDEVLDDDALAAAAGGQNLNSTNLVYASTFIPFDSSF